VNRKRAIILNTAIIFGFFAIFLRLFSLMVVDHKNLSERAKLQQVKTEDIQAMRGNIYDRKGREFAVNLELESLYCDPTEVDLSREKVKKLSSVLGVEPKVIRAKFAPERRFEWIDRKLSPQKAEAVKTLLGIKANAEEEVADGFGFIPEAKRLYPKGTLAAHVIGAVGLDNQALEGVELKYNRYLKTSGRKVHLERDASGRTLSSGINMEVTGDDVVLTLDEGLQYIVERELGRAMEKWKAVAGSVIMMDPFTGEILAMANSPSYNLNDIGRAGKNEVRDRAITDVYEPGSTFKVVIGTAALEEKIFSTESTFDVSKGSIEVGGKIVHDAHRHGVLTFQEVIQKSSNVGSIMIGMRLGKEKIYEYAKRFGFGEDTGIDLPGEVSGWIRKPETWSGTSIGAVPIGQGVAVTPLQVLRAYAAIANGGYLVKPHVVLAVRSHDGQTVASFDSAEKKRVISAKTAATFKKILETVVEEGGTATEASVAGNKVAGKTGTAQLIDRRTKRYSKDRYVSSFVGFVPADKPRLSMIVVIYEPKGEIYGGVVAGPVFRSIADQALSYMDVPRDDDPERNLLVVSR
jgi:cell division protein FtsI/penicillin-binding protein 2